MRVFISSTIQDLGDERALVRAELEAIGFEVFCSEYEGPQWHDAAATIVHEIEACHIFIGIYGRRYGFVPPPSRDHCVFDGQSSVTQAEFRLARDLSKPLLIYAKACGDYDHTQQLFISEVKDFYEGVFVGHFEAANELKGRVRADTVRLVTSLIAGEYRYPSRQLPYLAIFDTPQALCDYVSREIVATLNAHRRPSIGLFAGRTSGAIYDRFIDLCDFGGTPNIATARFYMNAEHFGMDANHPNTYRNFLVRHFLEPIRSVSTHSTVDNLAAIPSTVMGGSLDSLLSEYDAAIGATRIHLQLLGLAPNGQVASVDPSGVSAHELEKQRTSLVELSEESYGYLFPKPATRLDITMGIGNILGCADRILLVAYGERKAPILKKILLESVSSAVPASLLKKHHHLIVACDREAMAAVPTSWLAGYPKLVATMTRQI